MPVSEALLQPFVNWATQNPSTRFAHNISANLSWNSQGPLAFLYEGYLTFWKFTPPLHTNPPKVPIPSRLQGILKSTSGADAFHVVITLSNPVDISLTNIGAAGGIGFIDQHADFNVAAQEPKYLEMRAPEGFTLELYEVLVSKTQMPSSHAFVRSA